MNSRLLNWFIIVSIGLYISIPILGVVSFLSSPYTGIRFFSCENDMQVGGVNRTCIRTVDEGSPADLAGIRPGDMVTDINGLGLPSYAYIHDPDYLSSDNLPLFWDGQKMLSETIKTGKSVDIIIERDGIRKNFSLIPVSFSLRKVLDREGYAYFFIWTVLILPYLLMRKKRMEATVIFFIYWLFLGMGNMSTIFFDRDIAYPYFPLKVLHLLNYLPYSIAFSALIHFGLIFPERKGVIREKPWVLGIPYLIYVTIFLLEYISVIDNRYMISIFSRDLGWILFSIILLYKIFIEKDHLKKRQAQLVLIGVSGPYLLSYPLFILPKLFWGIEIIPIGHLSLYLLDLSYPVLPVLSLAIAVTKYKLLEIEEVLDYGVIFSATLLILFGAEFLFLSALSPLYSDMLYKSPYLSTVPAVLLIVFIYIPIRNRIKRLVERLFKRGTYSIDQEMQRFVLSVGICSEISVFDRFSSYVKRLLGPKGIYIIKATTNSPPMAQVLISEGDNKDDVLRDITELGEELWSSFTNNKTLYGFELTEKGILKDMMLETALFIPVFHGDMCQYIIILLPKWNNTLYSRKDRMLLEAVSVNIEHMIEADELRRAKARIEEGFRRERDHVMQEMHDGLGSILTNITVASQAAGRVFEDNSSKAKELISTINTCSMQASDFLRTGLTVLDNQEGDMGFIISGIRNRLVSMLEGHGLSVNITIGDNVEHLRVDANTNLNIVRCIQEAFNNILKHAGARNVEVMFARNNSHLKITINDDGRGFNTGCDTSSSSSSYPSAKTDRVKSGNGSGYGLKNISKRMEELNGSFEITSSPGRGTLLTLSIPV